ncbi:MAG: peptidoglycan DD-metalloendopeptidase family protein [Polyangiales bacterium]|nr:peptidoglycan DD-metalloendopeptidase family protein [Myxococcales bacterium]
MRSVVVLALTFVASAANAQLSRPTACSDCIAGWYYFDQNGGAAGSQDWNCATSSYDGHRGSDFSLRGGNGAIDTGYDVVAAADGTVESTQDGHFDRCGTCNAATDSRCGTAYGFGYGNHVVVNHGDTKVVYAHMRMGSVAVSPGQTIRCGQVVGQIASSGCSTGAHLHFEVRPPGTSSSSAYDPFQGMCSPTSPSRWASQGPHRGLPGATCGDPTPTCPAGTFPIWTCNAAATERTRCVDGMVMTEACPGGCVSMPVGSDDVCADAPTCPAGLDAEWRCDGDGRARCVGGEVSRETCANGCEMRDGDDVCRDAPVDLDGDGHNTSVDCDDADATRFPGATETCGDGVDQDCDGEDLLCPGQDGGPARDGGSVDDDGGATRDAGRREGRVDRAVGGCGCRSSGDARGLLPWLVGLWLVSRRRRR